MCTYHATGEGEIPIGLLFSYYFCTTREAHVQENTFLQGASGATQCDRAWLSPKNKYCMYNKTTAYITSPLLSD